MTDLGNTLVSICLGLGLSAATGFRIFVPLLMINLASRTGWLELSHQFAWMGESPALIIFAAATVLEIGAFYVPWLDNLLDSIASPAAVIAGTLVSASMIVGMDPMLKWCLAIIAGGGIAGTVQSSFVGARQVSALTTAGLGNPIVATLELVGSIFMTALSFFAPVIAFAVVIVLMIVVARLLLRRRRSRRTKTEGAAI
ncbi:MAG: DUF4126 domain-containing protein [Acidobacteriota bacterium]